MRPIATEHDALRHPLNDLLGTRANVRLMRLLTMDATGPIGTPEAAAQTGLTEAGARRALRKLVKTGVVEEIGGGRARRFQLRQAAHLVPHLTSLFRAERERFQQLLVRLKDIFKTLSEVRVAWIDATPSEPGRPLHLGLISDVRSLGYVEEEVRRRVGDIEAEYDLTIELHLFARADAPEIPWQHVTLVAGHVDEPGRDIGSTHVDRLERAERLSKAIADLIDRDESLLSRASAHLELLLQQDQGSAAHDLREWRDILARYSRHRLKEFLTSDSPRAQRLRQSSPFFAVLTSEERDDLLDAMEGTR